MASARLAIDSACPTGSRYDRFQSAAAHPMVETTQHVAMTVFTRIEFPSLTLSHR